MSLRRKLVMMSLGLYLITFVFTGVLVIENNYASQLCQEVERCLAEEDRASFSLLLFLQTRFQSEKDVLLSALAQVAADMHARPGTDVEIRDLAGKVLAASNGYWPVDREELEQAKSGYRTYLLRRNAGKRLLYISRLVNTAKGNLLLTFVRDVSVVEGLRISQYRFFTSIGLLGLLAMLLLVYLLARLVLRPLADLQAATARIAAGNYAERVNSHTKDELGVLAEQFNQMAQEVEQRVDELQVESERRQRYADNLTHELRTPLTSIIGYAELLQGLKYEPEVFQRGLGYIQSEGERLLKLSTALMELIRARKQDLHKEEINLEQLFDQTIEIMLPKAAQCQVTLLAKGEAIFPLNRQLMQSVLLNLLDNAISACPGPGSVTLEAGQTSAGLEITVTDTGRA